MDTYLTSICFLKMRLALTFMVVFVTGCVAGPRSIRIEEYESGKPISDATITISKRGEAWGEPLRADHAGRVALPWFSLPWRDNDEGHRYKFTVRAPKRFTNIFYLFGLRQQKTIRLLSPLTLPHLSAEGRDGAPPGEPFVVEGHVLDVQVRSDTDRDSAVITVLQDGERVCYEYIWQREPDGRMTEFLRCRPLTPP